MNFFQFFKLRLIQCSRVNLDVWMYGFSTVGELWGNIPWTMRALGLQIDDPSNLQTKSRLANVGHFSKQFVHSSTQHH